MRSRKKKALTGSTDLRVPMRFFAGLFLFLAALSFCPAQTGGALSLSAEISRLEKTVSAGALPSAEKYAALRELSRLYRLSGDSDSQLKTLERTLLLFPGDSGALLEQGRLCISLGEYEKAALAASALLGKKDGKDVSGGRLLLAQIEAFRSGNVRLLESLLGDEALSGSRAGIYYTLWKLSGLSSWKTKLMEDFPLSPEAGIAAGGAASQSPSPLWLLFPGREAAALSQSPAAAGLPPQSGAHTAEANTAPVSAAPRLETPDPAETVLQTGLFAGEANARSHAESLKKAGFNPWIARRAVTGRDYWAVNVSVSDGGANAMIKKLKEAGFDSFPVK